MIYIFLDLVSSMWIYSLLSGFWLPEGPPLAGAFYHYGVGCPRGWDGLEVRGWPWPWSGLVDYSPELRAGEFSQERECSCVYLCPLGLNIQIWQPLPLAVGAHYLESSPCYFLPTGPLSHPCLPLRRLLLFVAKRIPCLGGTRGLPSEAV